MSTRAPSPDELLEHAAWLRGLAAALVGSSGADDLVQETLLRAHGTPPAEGVPTGPWLARVAKNLFYGGLRKEEVRRRAHFVQEPPPTPEDLLDRLQTQRLLARLVAELAEPYRTTILLRYYEGLTSARIAEMMNVPPGTVRWRLKTGLGRLRTGLDGETHGDRKAWQRALLPLVPAVKGAFAVTRTLKVVLAVVSVLAASVGVYVAATRSGPAAPQAASPAGSAGSASAAVAAPGTVLGKTQRAEAPEPPRVAITTARAVEDPSLAAGAVSGHVVSWSTGRGVPNAQLTFAVDGAATAITADGQGAFLLLPGTRARHVLASVTAAGFLPFAPPWEQSPVAFEPRAGRRIDGVVVYLVPALDYNARVVTPDGKPAPGSKVKVIHVDASRSSSEAIRSEYTAGAGGEFTFHAPDWALLEARLEGYAPGRAAVDLAVQNSHRLTITLGPAGGKDTETRSIRGRVVDEKGAPVSGARVFAFHQGQSKEPAEHKDLHPKAEDITGDDGLFSLDGLDEGPHQVEAGAYGHSPAMRQRVAAGEGRLVMSLGPGSLLDGRVLDPEGNPVPSFRVVVGKRQGAITQTIASRMVVDAEGRFSLSELPSGDLQVFATAPAFAPSAPVAARLVAPPGKSDPVEVRLARGGRFTGRVVDRASQQPLANARLTVEAHGPWDTMSAAPFSASTTSDEDGHFELTGLAPGKRAVVAGAFLHHGRVIPLEMTEGGSLGPMTIDLAKVADGEAPHLELAGIGITVGAAEGVLIVEKVIPSGGAAEAGLVMGDVLVAVEGISVNELGADETLARIRGPEGTAVNLTVRHANGKLQTYRIIRRRIQA